MTEKANQPQIYIGLTPGYESFPADIQKDGEPRKGIGLFSTEIEAGASFSLGERFELQAGPRVLTNPFKKHFDYPALGTSTYVSDECNEENGGLFGEIDPDCTEEVTQEAAAVQSGAFGLGRIGLGATGLYSFNNDVSLGLSAAYYLNIAQKELPYQSATVVDGVRVSEMGPVANRGRLSLVGDVALTNIIHLQHQFGVSLGKGGIRPHAGIGIQAVFDRPRGQKTAVSAQQTAVNPEKTSVGEETPVVEVDAVTAKEEKEKRAEREKAARLAEEQREKAEEEAAGEHKEQVVEAKKQGQERVEDLTIQKEAPEQSYTRTRADDERRPQPTLPGPQQLARGVEKDDPAASSKARLGRKHYLTADDAKRAIKQSMENRIKTFIESTRSYYPNFNGRIALDVTFDNATGLVTAITFDESMEVDGGPNEQKCKASLEKALKSPRYRLGTWNHMPSDGETMIHIVVITI